MKQLSYLTGSDKWIWPYYSTMSDWDKTINTNVFRISEDENTKCVILIAINVYDMGIDNLDIKLVIYGEFLTSFDSKI